jgi:ABC-2 type transport system ATP-binding protein
MDQTDHIAVQTIGLSKSYKDVAALKSLDLTVRKNSVLGFLGPNGAGKTTTIKLLLGLIFPTTGSATVFGQDIVRDSVAIRSHIGYLPLEEICPRRNTAFNTLESSPTKRAPD